MIGVARVFMEGKKENLECRSAMETLKADCGVGSHFDRVDFLIISTNLLELQEETLNT